VLRITIALAVCAFAAGCATTQASNEPSAPTGAKERSSPEDYTTGSRLPRK
jgi:hypothetical protein